MGEIILNGVQLGFNDLSEEVQKKLYLQDKKKFREDASKSQYASIRKLLIEDEECEASILDEIFKVETEIYGYLSNLEMIWKHTKFEKTDEKRKMLAESDDKEIRCMLAEDEETSSKFLNEMLRREVTGENDGDVTEAIIQNSNFEIEEETIKVLANSEEWTNRQLAAKVETDSLKLNEMLIKEVQDEEKDDNDVKETIKNNPNFKMEEETIKVLANSEERSNRQWAAREETDYLKLNEMLQREQRKRDDAYVKRAIIENPNFKVTEENAKIFAKSDYWANRLIAAKSEDVSVEFLEKWYLEENDKDVLEAIEKNLDKKVISKHVQLSLIQKIKIRKVLKRFRTSKGSVSKCLNEILEIIS